MINNINSKYTFTGRPKTHKILPKLKFVFNETLPDLRSPSKACFLSPEEFAAKQPEIKDLEDRLNFIRYFIKSLYRDGGVSEHFRGLIGCVKAFKVANCDEFAEITKTICRMNGIKNCDMFAVYAKEINSRKPPRSLDHAVVALNVPKSKNNKLTCKPFLPAKHTVFVDMWLDGFIGKTKDTKALLKKIGLGDNETIMLKPLKTYEPDNKSFEKIKEEFPKLSIKV